MNDTEIIEFLSANPKEFENICKDTFAQWQWFDGRRSQGRGGWTRAKDFRDAITKLKESKQ